jgi:DNA-binding phage protein
MKSGGDRLPPFPISPLATGSAGPDFETDVGATYLAALLLGGSARGASPGETVRVFFQRGALGAPLDDLAIETESSVGRARLDLQVKRTFTFSAGDKNFASVINACWQTVSGPSFRSAPANRVGVATFNASRSTIQRVDRVTASARASSSAADFFQRIRTRGLSSSDMRKLVDEVTAQVREHAGAAATDEALLELFQHLVLVDFDLELEDSRDRTDTIERFRALVPGNSVEGATALWGHLRDVARLAGRTAGGYTAHTLREQLRRQSVPFLAPPSFASDCERLNGHTDLVLESIQDSIEGLVLDRKGLVDAVLDRLNQEQTVFLTGRGGAGKSAVLRAVGRAYGAKRPCLALAGERLAGDMPGWDGFAGMLGLQHGLDELVLALSGSACPCLLIDGVERIETPGGRSVVNDLLAAIGRLEKSTGLRWAIAITTRDETLPAVRDWLVLPLGGKIDLVRVPDLSAEEIALVARHLPHLSWVLAADRIRPIIGNAYFLRVLSQSRAQAPADPEMVTETFVHHLWWERLVGPELTRQQAMLELGRRALAAWKPRLLPQGIDAAALQSLATDAILRRDPGTDTFWFGHDILHEWTVARVLGQHDDDIVAFLESHQFPFWASRALQLLACNRLETAAGRESWLNLLRQVEADPAADRPWTEAVVTAPLRSARLADLLSVVGETLLEGDGSRLAQLLRAVRTQEIEPRNLAHLANRLQLSTEGLEALALDLANPRLETWRAVLRWLAPRLQELPENLRDELTRIMVTWLRATPPDSDFRREIAEAALAWHSVLRSPSGKWTFPALATEPYFDRLREIVCLAADAVPERIAEFLGEVRQTRRRSDLGGWLAQGQPTLARYAPAPYADFCLDVLVPGWRGDRVDR